MTYSIIGYLRRRLREIREKVPKRSVEDVYQELGTLTAQALGECWSSAWIVAQIGNDSIEFDFQYRLGDSAAQEQFHEEASPYIRQFYLLFEELHQMFERSGKAPWRSMTFHLERDGSFKIEFGYD